MSRVEEIQAAIDGLPPEEYRHILQWFRVREQQRWDEQLDGDASAGKLDFLFDEAESVREPRPRTGPPAAEPERPLPVKRPLRVKLPKYSTNASQLMPAQHIFDGSRARFRVHQFKGHAAAQRAVGTLQPTGRAVLVPNVVPG